MILCMRMILAIFIIFSSLNITTALAGKSFPQGDFSLLKPAGTARVSQIIAPNVLQLNDGRLIALPTIEFPDLYGPDSPGPFAATAQRVLNDMLLGQSVRLYQTPDKKLGRTNRMGHHLMHVQRSNDEIWVQGALVSLGLARVKTGLRNRFMAPQLYIQEMDARERKIGIWKTDSYRLLSADKIPESALNNFQIVEGVVQSVANRKNRIYINFGEDWRSDFTLTIPPEGLRVFKKEGIDPLTWKGIRLRARGWIEFYNGPNMEITHPERVEILSVTP